MLLGHSGEKKAAAADALNIRLFCDVLTVETRRLKVGCDAAGADIHWVKEN